MVNRPPSPNRPTVTSPATPDDAEDRVIVTTSHLRAYLDESLGYRPDEETLNEILMELERSGYVEWVTITRSGDYAWDLTESPDLIADAVAEAVVERIESWLHG